MQDNSSNPVTNEQPDAEDPLISDTFGIALGITACVLLLIIFPLCLCLYHVRGKNKSLLKEKTELVDRKAMSDNSNAQPTQE